MARNRKWVKFWSRIIPGSLKRKRRKVNGKDMFDVGIEAKKRLLEHSASAAHAYFMDPSLVDTMDDNRIGKLDTEVNSQDHKLYDADPHFVAEFEKYEENNKSKSLLEDDGMDAKYQLIPSSQNKGMGDLWSYLIVGPIQKIKSHVVPKVEGIVGELVEEANGEKAGGIEKMVPVTLESVHFNGATLLLLAYGDNEPSDD